MADDSGPKDRSRGRGRGGRGRGRGRGRGGGGGGRGSGGGGGEGRSVRMRGPDDAEVGEKPEREERPNVPVPPELIGKTAIGKIETIVRRGRGQFGFIFIGEGEGSRETTPRIYFNFKDYVETRFPPRRGYLVSFLCEEDDEGRPYATNLNLTPTGLVEAEKREEEYLKRQASSTGGETRAPREPRERRERRDKRDEDDRTVTLMVTCEGKSGEKQITAKLSQSIGKLKHTATTEFDAPIDYNVYCADGTLLNRSILAELQEGAIIHLKPAPATA